VPENPFQAMLGSPWRVASFVALVLVAGGVREELQRAFLLHRFDQALGGARLGVVITSLAFGLGHAVQGWDAMLVTGLLGAIWGALYVWRRNVIPGMVSHALFNVIQVLMAFMVSSGTTAT
jgi:membrane protease YdiL (CAAX protease family)